MSQGLEFSVDKIFENLGNSICWDSDVRLGNELRLLFSHLPEMNSESDRYLTNSELSSAGGMALNKAHAIECLVDGVRTARFLRAVNAFIVQKRKEGFKEVRVLYAGSGPLAPLILPMVYDKKSRMFQIDLIEFNAHSFDHLTQIVIPRYKALNKFIDFQCIHGDATSLDLGDKQYDLILSETMFRALYDEPQFAIMRHLKRYLAPEGRFILEDVKLSLSQCKYSSRKHYKLGSNSRPDVTEVDGQVFFQLSKELHTTFDEQCSNVFTSDWIDLKPMNPLMPEVCLETEVCIDSNHHLTYGDSVLTNPKCLLSRTNWPDKNFIRLSYHLSPNPHWTYELK